MGRITEYFDYINQPKEISVEYDMLNYTHITVTDDLKKLRKKVLSEKRAKNSKG